MTDKPRLDDLVGPPPDQEQPNRKSTTSDPTGRLDIFGAAGLPSVTDAADKIYGYVEGKANSIGTKIKRNRGLPPNAEPCNMLSLEEKAIILLGRAIGVTWTEIEHRIDVLRHENGEPVPTRDLYDAGNRLFKRHMPIVQAIQADLIEATEAFSPLVSGPQRFAWRSKVIEAYRRMLIALDAAYGKGEVSERDYFNKFRSIDKSMRPHLKWLDDIMKDSSIRDLLGNPSDRLREEAQEEQEREIRRLHEEGEIDDAERISRLRRLRHGED